MNQTLDVDLVAVYVARVRPLLDDLDPAERAEVLEELEGALRETAAEHDGDLEEVLGAPEEYVAAYRASAGLGSGAAPRRTRGFLRRRQAQLQRQPWWPRAAAIGRLLRPTWWSVRGAAYAFVIGRALGMDRLTFLSLGGALLVLAGAAMSTAIGDGRRHGRPRTHRVANVIAVIIVLLLWADTYDRVVWLRTSGSFAEGRASAVDERAAAGAVPTVAKLGNLYPFDRDGQPLDGVLLYDADGDPVVVVEPGARRAGVETDFARDAQGRAILNLYPLEQFAADPDGPGAGVAVPAPTVTPPDVAGPDGEVDAPE